MRLRTRLAVAAGLAVAVTAAGVAAALYVAARGELRGEVDRALIERAERVASRPIPRPGHEPLSFSPPGVPPPVGFGGANGYVQFVHANGSVDRPRSELLALPVSAATRAAAAGTRGRYFVDVTVQESPLRLLTVPIGANTAVQIARPLDEVNAVLTRLLVISAVVILAGIALAVAIGMLVSRTALAPVARFTRRTERLTGDPDLSHRLDVEGRDELARLAHSFNRTLDALERSVDAQRHLVADASHELRTPLASLRTNIQVLASADPLPDGERRQLLADVLEELDELTALVGDVVELARGAQPPDLQDEVRLDQVAWHALERGRRRAPGMRFETDLAPSVVYGMPDRINRAVGNLLDNAIKWSPPDAPVTVRVRHGEVTVRDHGPGFAPEDLPHVFNRFYRADGARNMPGSGLGLAIVRQVAEAHGGSASAANADGGGALMRVSFGLEGAEEPGAQGAAPGRPVSEAGAPGG